MIDLLIGVSYLALVILNNGTDFSSVSRRGVVRVGRWSQGRTRHLLYIIWSRWCLTSNILIILDLPHHRELYFNLAPVFNFPLWYFLMIKKTWILIKLLISSLKTSNRERQRVQRGYVPSSLAHWLVMHRQPPWFFVFEIPGSFFSICVNWVHTIRFYGGVSELSLRIRLDSVVGFENWHFHIADTINVFNDLCVWYFDKSRVRNLLFTTYEGLFPICQPIFCCFLFYAIEINNKKNIINCIVLVIIFFFSKKQNILYVLYYWVKNIS